jgi:paraquat-inducible protein A
VWVPIASIELLVCRDCDAVHRQVSLRKQEIACCTACGALLARHSRLAVEQLLALTLTAAILFLIANANPVLAIEVGGMRTEANGWTAAFSMAHGWMGWAAAVLAVTVFVVPMLQIAITLWVLSFAWLARRAPGLRLLLVALHRLRPWSMTEVLLLGVLVAIVKLSGWVHVVPGAGIWALAGLTFLLTILTMVDARFWWTLAERRE